MEKAFTNRPIYLITTAEERFWPSKGKVVFLGEWCKKYNRMSKWLTLDSITARPYAIEPNEKEYVNKLLDELFNELLHELVTELNKIHNTTYSKRYWSIIVGPWLYLYTKVIINRYGVLNQTLSENNIDKTIISNTPDVEPTQTHLDFIRSLDNDLWNCELCRDMLQHYPNLNIELIQRKINLEVKSGTKRKRIKSINWKSYIRPIMTLCFNILSLFSRKTDAVIIKSYLPFSQEIKLQVLLRQVPQLWNSPPLSSIQFTQDTKVRKVFFQDYAKHTGVQSEARRLLSKLIPTCYLEGYKFMVERVKCASWPSSPRFIFTSNSFHIDEFFKFWTAAKVEQGVPYYIGQHGYNYGSLKGSEIWPEITTCDKFFSWGWNDAYKFNNAIPAFIFQLANRGKLKNNQTGGILLVERGPGIRDGCHDRHYEHILYQKYVFSFFSFLNDSLQDKTTVRLHHGSKELNSSDHYMWKKHYRNINIDSGFGSIYKLIKKNRIVVHAYGSTGILETLSLNIPTIAFWKNGLDEIIDEAAPYYKLLMDAGIVYTDEKSAAQHINKHWNNINLWWHKKETQNARIKFCNKYAKIIDKPILNLAKLLNDG